MIKLFNNFNIPIIKRALALLGKKKSIFIAFILGFCGIELCCSVLYTIGIKGVLNAITNKDIDEFWMPMMFIIINYIIWWIYAPISTYATEKISKSIMRDYKINLCDHIVHLPMRYHDNKPTGELISVLTNDVNCLSGVYDWSFFQVMRSATGGIGGVIIMAVIDWRFAIIVFSFGTISIIISSYFSRRLEVTSKEQQECLAKSSTDAYELVKAAKTIRLLSLQKSKEISYADTTNFEADIKMKIGRINARMNSCTTAVNSLSYVFILFTGALFVYYHLSDWGTVVALMGLKGTTDMLFVECGQFMAGMQTNVAGIKRLFEMTDNYKENIYEKSLVFQNINEALIIQNISFSYDKKSPVLSGFNLTLQKNALTALIYESGSGKSTVMKLILGLYPPDEGQIILSSINMQNIREYTAYVPQEPWLFRGTVYENIAFGNQNANKEEIIFAAKVAGADEFIQALEFNYDTVLYDDGKSLSGGQKQRIAIARALVKDAPILLFDEITSALDKETEMHILQTVKNISKTKAVLFITHKTDIQKWADEVIYMQ